MLLPRLPPSSCCCWSCGVSAKREFNSREEVVSGRVPPYTYSLILCAMRMFLSDFSQYYKVSQSLAAAPRHHM